MNRVSQQHGLQFEDFIRQKNGCLGIPRLHDSPFDIPGLYNKEFGLDLSAKTVHERSNGVTGKIGLASAVRFAAITGPYQMTLGVHSIVSNHRLFHEIRTYVISKELHKTLLGGLTADELMQYDLRLKGFPRTWVGDILARNFAVEDRERLVNKHHGRPLVELAYKVNEQNRRLQLEIHLAHLDPALVRIDRDNYRGTRLPLSFDLGV